MPSMSLHARVWRRTSSRAYITVRAFAQRGAGCSAMVICVYVFLTGNLFGISRACQMTYVCVELSLTPRCTYRPPALSPVCWARAFAPRFERLLTHPHVYSQLHTLAHPLLGAAQTRRCAGVSTRATARAGTYLLASKRSGEVPARRPTRRPTLSRT
eukprot:6194726-Pleurochrysis_carterae.AAC.1